MSIIQQLLASYHYQNPSGNGEQVVWLGKTSVTEAGDGGLTCTHSNTTGFWGSSGAYSSQSFASGNAKVEFTVNQLGHYGIMLGLSNATDAAADNNYTNIDFAAFLWIDSKIQAFENGVSKATSGAVSLDDKISVSVESGKVIYAINGAAFYTNNSPTLNYPLKVDCTLTGLGAKFGNPQIFR